MDNRSSIENLYLLFCSKTFANDAPNCIQQTVHLQSSITMRAKKIQKQILDLLYSYINIYKSPFSACWYAAEMHILLKLLKDERCKQSVSSSDHLLVTLIYPLLTIYKQA